MTNSTDMRFVVSSNDPHSFSSFFFLTAWSFYEPCWSVDMKPYDRFLWPTVTLWSIWKRSSSLTDAKRCRAHRPCDAEGCGLVVLAALNEVKWNHWHCPLIGIPPSWPWSPSITPGREKLVGGVLGLIPTTCIPYYCVSFFSGAKTDNSCYANFFQRNYWS